MANIIMLGDIAVNENHLIGIKSRWLMIGDLIFYKKKVVRVKEILQDVINPEWDGEKRIGGIPIEDCCAIPLMAEMLERNGFKKLQINNKAMYKYQFKYFEPTYNGGFFINRCYLIKGKETYLSVGQANFVHELQNFFRIDGLTIADKFTL